MEVLIQFAAVFFTRDILRLIIESNHSATLTHISLCLPLWVRRWSQSLLFKLSRASILWLDSVFFCGCLVWKDLKVLLLKYSRKMNDTRSSTEWVRKE